MTNITTPRFADADQAEGTDRRQRRHLSPVLAIGISAAAAAIAVVAIATDDVGSVPVRRISVPAAQSVVDGPVPDGVPCPDNPIRGQVMC